MLHTLYAIRAQRFRTTKVSDRSGGAPPLAARLIVLPRPPDKAEVARRQMRKKAHKAGYTPSADALVTAGCVMLITSLPAADWPAQRVLDLYCQRWQLELAFKRLKPLLDLERWRAIDSELVNAWIHAVLVIALLIDLARPSAQTEARFSPLGARRCPIPIWRASLPSSLAA